MAKAAAMALLAVAALIALASPAAGASGMIKVVGGEFADESCDPFYFSGYNTWEILETAGGACCGGRTSVTTQLQTAKANNLTVVRLFAYGVQSGYQLQTGTNATASGGFVTTYNESAFTDMDFILSEAATNGLKVIISLASNWIYSDNTSGTKCWYTNLTATAPDCDAFYTDPNAIAIYEAWVQTITSRVNTITNVTYGADPTIFAWDLINEGRCDDPTDCSASDILSWIQTVAPVLKSSVQQLVTVGEDGFLQAANCLSSKINPVTNNLLWPLQTGEDFVPNHYVDAIDYASIHLWPDNWARTDLPFGQNWLEGHANLSQLVLQKPMVVEEFGKAYGGDTASSGQGQTQQEQVDWYSLVYSIVENSIDTGYSIKGVAFWRWDAAVSPTAALAPFDNAATISSTGTTFTTIIEPFSQRIAQKVAAGGKVAGCTPGSVSPATSVSTSSVSGRRLMQAAPVTAPASGPAGAAANSNSLVPESLCNAYPAQPPSVG